MIEKILICIYFINVLITCSVIAQAPTYEAIDKNYLESLLDTEECTRQINAIRRNPNMLITLADAGLRVPKGILQGNTVDFGNYHQCLSIDAMLDDLNIQGKYCSLKLSLGQSFEAPLSNDFKNVTTFNPKHLHLDKETLDKVTKYYEIRRNFLGDYDSVFNSSTTSDNPFSGIEFTLAICIPKPCSTEQFISSMIFSGIIGFDYTENYCRFPGDKTWAPADTAAVVVFSILGIVTLISTCYDISYRFLLKRDLRNVNKIYQSFSIYTNGQRITTFSYGPGTVRCLDGIRSISMIWVIVGHAYSTENFISNPIDIFIWLFSAEALWITTAPMAVDMFLTIAGIVLVYTTVEKMNSKKFLKNIHWFYINRLVRINPLLAVAVLLQASFFNRIVDGPYWSTVVNHTNWCRINWWKTLFHIQNFVSPTEMCITHSWYLAIDFHLYFVSPLVLYWVLSGKKRQAWISLTAALLMVLVASTIYNFHINVRAGTVVPARESETSFNYHLDYYFNTLPRASPFFVGLVFGYILHIYRNKKVHLTLIKATLFWICSLGIFTCIIYFKYAVKQTGYYQPNLDNIMNSIMRPAWGAALCWVIFACVHGYAGPVDWFLSLDLWRMPSRLSYAMFIFHYPMMFAINGIELAPVYFTPARYFATGFEYTTYMEKRTKEIILKFFKFLAYWTLTMMVAFFFTLVIDSPISFLMKHITTSGPSKGNTKPLTENAQKPEVAE